MHEGNFELKKCHGPGTIIPYSIAKTDHDCDHLSCVLLYQSLSLCYIIIFSPEVEKLTVALIAARVFNSIPLLK